MATIVIDSLARLRSRKYKALLNSYDMSIAQRCDRIIKIAKTSIEA